MGGGGSIHNFRYLERFILIIDINPFWDKKCRPEDIPVYLTPVNIYLTVLSKYFQKVCTLLYTIFYTVHEIVYTILQINFVTNRGKIPTVSAHPPD